MAVLGLCVTLASLSLGRKPPAFSSSHPSSNAETPESVVSEDVHQGQVKIQVPGLSDSDLAGLSPVNLVCKPLF